MGKVNFNVKTAIESTVGFQNRAQDIVTEKYEENKEKFLQEFDNHPVTKEIAEGPNASNISNTLNGIGNLFSYIGFYANENPIGDLKALLIKNFNLKKKNNKLSTTFVISYPDIDKIQEETPMPWEGGRSWATGVERGISGFGYYVYKKFLKGRSQEALQVENKVRGSTFKKVRYMSEIIRNFVNNIK
jgi:hypothetical protein